MNSWWKAKGLISLPPVELDARAAAGWLNLQWNVSNQPPAAATCQPLVGQPNRGLLNPSISNILVTMNVLEFLWYSCASISYGIHAFFIPRSVCTSTSFLCFEASLSKCLCSVSLMISFSWIPVPLVFWYPSSISISDEERMVVGASVFSHVQYKHFYLWLYGWWSIFL